MAATRGQQRPGGQRHTSIVDCHGCHTATSFTPQAPPWKSKLRYFDIWEQAAKGNRPKQCQETEAGAPQGYAALMRQFWDQDPLIRPSFSEAVAALERIERRFELTPQEVLEVSEKTASATAANHSS